jgi:hypothetical protein
MGQRCADWDSQDKSSDSNYSQRLLPILAEMPAPSTVDPDLIGKVQSLLDSIRLCAQMSDYTHDRICEVLAIDPGHWSRMMQGRAHFPTNKLVDLQRLCGNTAPTQYLAAQFGWQLGERKSRQFVERAA